ncbi:MAG: hypothetical protein LBU84_09805 [Prevotella sp.]|nr:hypothetical protein [Prevotella sp.]
MKRERQSIIMITGISNIYKQCYIFLLCVVISFFMSCNKNIYDHSKYACDSLLHYDSITNINVYINVDEMPKFSKYGEIDLMKYISDKYNNPSVQDTFQFSFNLQFVVDKRGVLHGIRIKNKKVEEYTKSEIEMIKVFRAMPKWIPGKCANRNVNVLMSCPFKLSIRES